MKTQTITAILDAGALKGKIKTSFNRELRIYLHTMSPKFSFTDGGATLGNPVLHRQLVFEWREQVSLRTHRYTLKEII